MTIRTPAAAPRAAIEATIRRNSAISQPSSMMKAADSHKRPRAAHRQIVDRAANRDLADVAAGKLQRRHHETVGGKGQPRAGFLQRGIHQPGLILHARRLEDRR